MTTRPSRASSRRRRTARASRSARSTTTCTRSTWSSPRAASCASSAPTARPSAPPTRPTTAPARTLIAGRRRLRRGRRRDGLHGDHLHGAARGAAQVLPARGARDAPVGEGPRRPRGRRGAARQRALRARLQPLHAQARVPVPRDDPQHRRRPPQPAVGQAHAQLDRRARGAAAVHLAAPEPRAARHAEPRPVAARERDEGARQGRVRRGQLQGLQHRQREPRAGVLGGDRDPDGRASHRGRRARLSRSPTVSGASATSTRARRSRCASSRRRPRSRR